MVLCVGCGGVGKTTTCAALGLAAARRGKRVLCLTIDPARRLAESLGIEQLETEAQLIDPQLFADAGLAVSGSLTVMMLDTKRTFDSLVTALASSAEKRDWIFGNLLYKYISETIAGTQEYMAMEKLYAVKDDPRYDLVLLDTPPTSHALEFLDAPQRLVDGVDSPAVRWFIKAFRKSDGLSFNLLRRSAATILKGMGHITGGTFLEQMALFISEVNELFGGWRARAAEVSTALRGPDVAYVLVTTPEPMPIREVLFFAERLEEQRMHPDAYVVNRMHDVSGDLGDAGEIAAAAARHGLDLSDDTIEHIAAAAQEEKRRGQLDRLHLIALDEVFSDTGTASKQPTIAYVPDFPREIHDLRRLMWVADALAPTS